jgi:hypothetical protein
MSLPSATPCTTTTRAATVDSTSRSPTRQTASQSMPRPSTAALAAATMISVRHPCPHNTLNIETDLVLPQICPRRSSRRSHPSTRASFRFRGASRRRVSSPGPSDFDSVVIACYSALHPAPLCIGLVACNYALIRSSASAHRPPPPI